MVWGVSMKLNFVATFSLAVAATACFGQQLDNPRLREAADKIRLPIRSTPMNETIGGYLMVKYPQNVAARIEADAAKPKATALAGWGTFVRRIGQSGWTMWQIPDSADYPSLVARVKADPRVVTVQKLNRIYPLSDPNDPDFNAVERSEDFVLNFGDQDLSFLRLWHLRDDNALDAWADWPNTWYTAANKPADTPTIAIIDTGCDMNHPDFINAGGASSNSAQGGQLDYSRSVSFRFGEVTGDPTEDMVGHGTHVTGICLAAGNNGGYAGHGVIGTGYNGKGMILRVFDDSGNGSDADAAAAMYYAADHGADIVNLSLGTTNFSQLFQDAVTYAWQKGCLIVAAGNESGSGGGALGPIYPAACSGVLAVSANGAGGIPATSSYSGTGRYVDIAAPGGDVTVGSEFIIIQYVYATSMRGDGLFSQLSDSGQIYPPYTKDYSYLVGTSMACPNVSGAACLYYGKKKLRQDDGWSNLRAYRTLERAAANVMGAPHGAWEPTQGYGCLDMWSTLEEYDARDATSGGLEGIVYANGTPTGNVSVRAQKLDANGNPAGVTFSTTTATDGTYRFDELPEGSFKIWSAPFGNLREKYAKVVPGSDFTGCDFWCGSFTGDSTAPTVVRLKVQAVGANYVDVRHWGYDTETGIDGISMKIGTASGGSDVLADTRIIIDTNVNRLSGLTLVPGQTYYVTGTYVNGAGAATAKTASFTVPGGSPVSGTLALQDFGGSLATVPVSVQLRTPGTSTVVATYTVTAAANGTFSFAPTQTGTYDLAFKASHWLRAKVANVVVGGAVSVGSISLVNGDVNGDNQVSASDQAALSAAYRSTSSSGNWNASADLNGDGQVSASDQAILSKNYRKTGA